MCTCFTNGKNKNKINMGLNLAMIPFLDPGDMLRELNLQLLLTGNDFTSKLDNCIREILGGHKDQLLPSNVRYIGFYKLLKIF